MGPLIPHSWTIHHEYCHPFKDWNLPRFPIYALASSEIMPNRPSVRVIWMWPSRSIPTHKQPMRPGVDGRHGMSYFYNILLECSQHYCRTAELSLASCCDLRKLVVSNASSSYLYLEAETYIETFLLCFSRRMLAVQKLRVMRDFCKAGKVGLCLRQVDKSGLVST